MENDVWQLDNTQRPSKNPFQYKSVRIISLILLIGILGSVGYQVISHKRTGPSATVPLIEAPITPHRIKPEATGAPIVPHQDKTIYDKMSGSLPEEEEKILPQPEMPLEPLQEPVEESQGGSDPIKDLEKMILEKRETPESEALPQSSYQFSKVKGGLGTIQAGSLPTRSLAEQEWRRLLKQHLDIFKEFKPQYVKVDLGRPLGVRHRIQIKGLESQEIAREMCKVLESRGERCLVIGG